MNRGEAARLAVDATFQAIEAAGYGKQITADMVCGVQLAASLSLVALGSNRVTKWSIDVATMAATTTAIRMANTTFRGIENHIEDRVMLEVHDAACGVLSSTNDMDAAVNFSVRATMTGRPFPKIAAVTSRVAHYTVGKDPELLKWCTRFVEVSARYIDPYNVRLRNICLKYT